MDFFETSVILSKSPKILTILGCIVSGVDVEKSSYFPSNTVPLKVAFVSNASSDASSDAPPTIPAIYKVGDDLRQDQLTIQMIRVMDKLWFLAPPTQHFLTCCCLQIGTWLPITAHKAHV